MSAVISMHDASGVVLFGLATPTVRPDDVPLLNTGATIGGPRWFRRLQAPGFSTRGNRPAGVADPPLARRRPRHSSGVTLNAVEDGVLIRALGPACRTRPSTHPSAYALFDQGAHRQGIQGWAGASHPAPQRGCTRCLRGGGRNCLSGGRWEELPRAAATLCREQGERRQCPPGYGEGNHHVYGELLGMSSREIKALAEEDLNVGQ